MEPPQPLSYWLTLLPVISFGLIKEGSFVFHVRGGKTSGTAATPTSGPSPSLMSSCKFQPPPQEVPFSHQPGITGEQAASAAEQHEHILSASVEGEGGTAGMLCVIA